MIEVQGPTPQICEVIERTLVGENAPAGRVDVFFVDSEEITALNAEHMGGTGPTDVLSFPIDGVGVDGVEVANAVGDRHIGDRHIGDRHIGDIVICPEVAEAQAADHMGGFDAEMKLLAIHAALHLCGYDHHEPSERQAMWAKEAHYLAHYGLEHPGDQQ